MLLCNWAATAAPTAPDYGEIELSPPELYEEALAYLYGIEGKHRNRANAIYRLKKAAKADYAPAHNLLGSLYLERNGLFPSPRKALSHFEQAAQLGDPIGQYNAAYSYFAGRGTKKDIQAAEDRFLSIIDPDAAWQISPESFGAARHARASSNFLLGVIYADEDEARQDQEKATRMFHAADELGHPTASMFLAFRYARGDGAEQDQEKSSHFLERYKTASLNHLHNSYSQAYFQGMDRDEIQEVVNSMVQSYEDEMSKRVVQMQFSLAVSLLDEEEIYSPEQAYVWLKPIATEDHPGACIRLARLYYRGEGVAQDKAKAREILELGAKTYSMARYNLAVMLLEGEGGPVEPQRGKALMEKASIESWYPAHHYLAGLGNPVFLTSAEALKLVEAEANKNNPQAVYCLGRRYTFGIAVDRDFEKARSLILQAGELGNAPARYFYGVYMANDVSFFGKSEEDKAIQEAAEANHPPAIHHLGTNLEAAGKKDQALEAYRRAAAMGHASSINKIGTFYRAGKAVEKNLETAFEHFQQAARAGDAIGFLNLGFAYEKGEGTQADPKKAYECYEEATRKGAYYGPVALGNLLASGQLGEPAWEEAIPHWQEAAGDRMKEAFLRLGDCYRDGLGVKQNFTLAASNYQAANNLYYYGDAEATYRLNSLLLIEDNPNYDPQKALNQLRVQEFGGTHPLARYQLALMNLDGIGLKANPRKAFRKLLATATLLGEELREGLGEQFEQRYSQETELSKANPPFGNGVDHKRSAAIDSCYRISQLIFASQIKKVQPADGLPWLRIAAEKGHAAAQLELGKLYLAGNYTTQDSDVGWDWIMRSSGNLPAAQHFVGSHYFSQQLDRIDELQAVALLRAAARAGHQESADLLRKHGYQLTEDDAEDLQPENQKEGQDDGFDHPIDIDMA